jgi:capsule polysaccharide export protein KpsE/RkpR
MRLSSARLRLFFRAGAAHVPFYSFAVFLMLPNAPEHFIQSFLINNSHRVSSISELNVRVYDNKEARRCQRVLIKSGGEVFPHLIQFYTIIYLFSGR